jgi:hypothetical protein
MCRCLNGGIDTGNAWQGSQVKIAAEDRDMTAGDRGPSRDTGYLERLLFPQGRLHGFLAVVIISGIFSLLLTGTQILRANWGMIDDHEIFKFLGPDLKLPATEIWNTLLTKTEVGQLQGRFRPSFYFVTLVQAWLFGPDVHLWYIRNSVCFALFLSGFWWTLSRHVVAWLGGAITAWIALLPLWAGIWSRLGPSEIWGAALLGILLFAADAILFSASPWVRRLAAIVLALVALVLAEFKETFLPLAAGGAGFVLVLAGLRRQLSWWLIGPVAFVVLIGVSAIAFVVSKELGSAGVDYYGKTVGSGTTILHAVVGVFDALLRTWWVWVLPIVFMQLLNVLPRRPWVEWISESRLAFAGYAFLILMYAAQCGLYRMSFPHNTRYDFPAMLLVPLTCCILVCEAVRRLRQRFPDRIVNYAQLTVAVFLIFGLVNAHLGRPPDLAQAVKRNIDTTTAFFSELQGAVRAAREAPDRPVILDAYGPIALEGVYSVRTYLRAYGVQNPIALRYHPNDAVKDSFSANLQNHLSELASKGDAVLVPLDSALQSRQCVSVGLYGPPDTACMAYQINAQGPVTAGPREQRLAGIAPAPP